MRLSWRLRRQLRIKSEILQEMKRMKEKWENRVKVIEDRLTEIEEYIREQREEKERGLEELESLKASVDELSEVRSRGSWLSSRGSSRLSLDKWSDSLSDKDIGKIKRMLMDRDKEERRNNIVIKGANIEGRVTKEWVEELIKGKLGIEIRIVRCKLSGKMIVATVEGEEAKKSVMLQKSKLKGGNIFIENDLLWEERKVQEKMNRGARGKEKKARI